MSARYGPTQGVKPTPNASPMRNERGNPVALPSRRRSSSRMRNGMVMRPTMCIPSTISRMPPIRCSQYTRSPASAPTSAMATHKSVNTTLKPRTNASACATVRMRCVPASAASPAMFTRNAGTSGRTQGEANDRIPAPNAIATFTRTSLGCLPRIYDEVEAVKPARPLERHGALGRDVSRTRVRRKDEGNDPSKLQLVEAVLDEGTGRLSRVAVTPDPRRELVRHFDLGALPLDRKEPDLPQEL